METPRWWDYLRRSNVTPKEVINLLPVSSYDQAICACLFYCVVIWEKNYCTSCVLFACRSIRMRSAHAWNVNDVISVIEPMCWRFNVFLYLYVNKYTDCSLCIWLLHIVYLFLLHTTSHYIHMWYFFIIYSTILFNDIRYFIINYLFL